jgi:hypothetical protein
MKPYYYSLSVLLAALFLSGCLIVEKRSYEITMYDQKSGSAVVTFTNIRSDAIGNNEFTEDVSNLIDTYSGPEFIKYWKQEGIHIKDRKLEVVEGQLNGMLEFEFDDITNVENIRFDDGFYYLTRAIEDSIQNTNGQLIESGEYQRILWDETMTTLKFVIYENPDVEYRDLAPVIGDWLNEQPEQQ